jgi:hypothetical protein
MIGTIGAGEGSTRKTDTQAGMGGRNMTGRDGSIVIEIETGTATVTIIVVVAGGIGTRAGTRAGILVGTGEHSLSVRIPFAVIDSWVAQGPAAGLGTHPGEG